MSFGIVCPKCGAPSSHSTGICPYCRTFFNDSKKPSSPNVQKLAEIYDHGNLPEALSLAAFLEKQAPECLKDSQFLLLYIKTLIEVDGPTYRIRALINQGRLADAANPVFDVYQSISEAMDHLDRAGAEVGEKELEAVLKQDPANVHALFILGAHLFWSRGESDRSRSALEKCVKLHPNFLRAWGCLASIYEKTGNAAMAARAYGKCVALEGDAKMKTFFEQKMNAVGGSGA